MRKAFLEDGETWMRMRDVVVDIADESRKSENWEKREELIVIQFLLFVDVWMSSVFVLGLFLWLTIFFT